MTNQWAERIASHQAVSLLNEVSTLIEGAPVTNPNMSVDAATYMQRAQAVIGNFKARLDTIEAALVPVPALDNATPHLQAAQAEIQAFLTDNDEAHLRNSDGHLDRLLMEMRSLPTLGFAGETGVATKAAQDYAERLLGLEAELRAAFVGLRQEMDAQSASFTDSANVSERAVEDATKAAEERLGVLSTTAEARAAEIAADSQAKIAELRAEIGTQKGRLDQAIAQQQSSFAEEQSRRLEQFSDAQEKRETAFAERTEAVIEEVRGKLDALLGRAASSVEQLSQEEERAAQIVAITAASSVAEAYVKVAKEQRQQADWWRYAALAFVAILIGYQVVLAVVSLPAADQSFGGWVPYLGVKVPIGVLIGSPFFYAIAQSGRHRRREEEAERLALELTSFRPFLSELPQQERSKEIIDATKRYFPGQQRPSPPEDV